MKNKTEKIQWLEFDLLEPYPHVLHGVFSRRGGVSQGSLASLNASETVGDHPDAVKVNRDLIRKALAAEHLVVPSQMHGANIHRVTAKNLGKTPQVDALFTTEKGIALGVTHADCQAALFYDPVHEAVAAVHCGWRGSVQNIYARTIDSMQREIGTKPQNLLVCISPSLGPDHAEFTGYKHELPQEFWSFMKSPNHFDFWAISKKQLSACGIPDRNIEMASVCSYCNEEDYFSHRRDKQTGRNATAIAMKN